MSKITKAFSADVTVENGKRQVSAVITMAVVDRDKEVVISQGVNAKQYMANPVVLYNHTYSGSVSTSEKLPVGKCVAMKRTNTGIEFKMEFAQRPATLPETEPWLPDTLLSLYQQGVMRAFSIGFDSTETRPATNKDIETFGSDCRRVISKSTLYEVSCVALPANQEAVATAVSKGLTPAAEPEEKPAPVAAKHIVVLADMPAEPEPIPGKRVIVKAIDLTRPEGIKRVHRVVEFPEPEPAPDPVATVKRLIVREVAKAKGRLYAD